MSGEHVLVAGAGIAGLGAALALGGADRHVTLIDRDRAAPTGDAEDAFLHWERRGATQLRHSHVFLGRLTTLIQNRYPELLEELTQSGARVFTFEDGLPPPLRPGYVRQKGDEELAILFSRRTTLELVMRRYASRLANVTFLDEAGVRGPIMEGSTMRGLKVERAGTVEEMRADLVVDATGRNTAFPDWLRETGIAVSEEESPAGILYFTRHYRLKDAACEPPRDGTPGAGDLGYIKFGVFPADNRHFSITLAIPEIETELRLAVVKPEVFERVCGEIPGCARWTDPARAEPASQVFAMGNLKSVWRTYNPEPLNFFALGDAAVRTNPLYGRGCSAGIVHAHVLREVLDATPDAQARAAKFAVETRKTLRPFYDSMVRQDKQAIKRAENERDPAYVPSRRAKMIKSLLEDAIGPATRGDINVLRAFSRAFHMIDDPNDWWKRPDVVAKLMTIWATPKAWKRARGFYPPKFGPERAEMFAKLELRSV